LQPLPRPCIDAVCRVHACGRGHACIRAGGVQCNATLNAASQMHGRQAKQCNAMQRWSYKPPKGSSTGPPNAQLRYPFLEWIASQRRGSCKACGSCHQGEPGREPQQRLHPPLSFGYPSSPRAWQAPQATALAKRLPCREFQGSRRLLCPPAALYSLKT
jgi:hypothetical protein